MFIEMSYGKEVKILDISDKNVAKIINPNEKSGVKDPIKEVENSLKRPIGSPTLKEIIAKFNSPKIVIIVNDITRPVPYKWILPPLIEELKDVNPENIEFIVATGIHRHHTDAENRELFSEELVSKYHFSNHDCDNNLVNLGTLSGGTPLFVNKKAVEADIIIGTGMISLHYFAGFSGGRKSVLPGISGRETIMKNHSQMVAPNVKSGVIENNPVHKEMMEAAKKVGLTFILNVITNSKKEIVQVVSGDMEKAWFEGIKTCGDLYFCKLDKRYPVVFASAGGYPKDINVYQAQKALENASEATENGGTIVLLAECQEGFGEPTFEEWIKEANNISDIFSRLKAGFKLGGHKAYLNLVGIKLMLLQE